MYELLINFVELGVMVFLYQSLNISLSAFGLDRNFWSNCCRQSCVVGSVQSSWPVSFFSPSVFLLSPSSLTKLEFFCWSST